MKNKFLKLSALLLVVVAFSSCLKDKHYDDNEYGSLRFDASQQKVVSIGLTTTDTTNESQVSFLAAPTSGEFALVPVTIAGGVPAEQDVHVVLDTMNSLVDQTSFFIPPSNMFSIVSKTVTIPKGQSVGYLKIKLIPNDFIGNAYALGFKIVSVDGGYLIADGNKRFGIAEFAIANAFEGDYSDVGIRYNYSSSPIAYNVGDPIPAGYLSTTSIPSPKHLETIDATHSALDFANLGAAPNSYQYILDLGSVGTANQDYSIGVSLNSNAAAGNSMVQFKQATYNPVTKTFKFIVVYNNNGSGTGLYRLLFETLTKLP